jgi:transcriptional regulator with XRE-family HTH domain
VDMNLKQLRKMAALTQLELAQRCGVSRMKLSLAECGYVDLYPEELAGVHKTLLDAIEKRDAQLRGVLSAEHLSDASV